LEIEKIESNFSVATDGLSSNSTLNIFDELRGALMMHSNIPLKTLADRLIKSITLNGAEAMRSNAGKIVLNAPADFALVLLPDKTREDELALQTILHTKKVDGIWIDGIEILLA